jgi:membrane-associated phospholipid phosphatase
MSPGRSFSAAGLVISALAVLACSEPTMPRDDEPAPSFAKAPPSSELASPVWQQRARALVGSNSQSPWAASRTYAALSIAQYQAVLAVGGSKGRSGDEARRGAVAAASVRVLSFLYSAAAATLEAYLTAEDSGHPHFARGVAAGLAAGDALVAHLMTDNFTAPWTGTIPVGPGFWTANGPPAGANLGGVRPYFLDTTSQFRSAPPPAFGSAEFNAGLNDVVAVSQARTAQQTATALFWNFPGGTHTPAGYWNEKAELYIEQAGLDERAATHVFALMQAAQFDALLACWEAKYTYFFIRPVQANPAITTVFPIQPNHPSYPSGHSCVSSSSARVLAHFFPGRTAELDALVTEGGLSRLYAGIHYPFDMSAGRTLGQAVADWAIAHDRSDP